MSLFLKNGNSSQFPPGNGWGFTDPKTKMVFNGWEGDWNYVARKVIEHRKANPAFYPDGEGQDLNAVVQEIFKQKHSKMPWLFRGEPDKDVAYSSKSTSPSQVANSDSACVCGSKEVILTYCPTCAGRRVTSKKCASCGKERKL